jgi:hypothetical protein
MANPPGGSNDGGLRVDFDRRLMGSASNSVAALLEMGNNL